MVTPSAWADTIWVGSGRGRGLEQQVNVQGVENGELIYLLNGNRASTPLTRVRQIQIDNAPDFSAAEAAFARGDWEQAAQMYEQTARQGRADWIRQRATRRLVEAAAAAGLFDQAVTGYVALIQLDPEAAASAVPKLGPELTSDQLAAAEERVRDATSASSLQPQQRKALLTFQLQLQNRRGDEEAAQQTVARLTELVGDQPGESVQDRRLFAQVLIGQARLALANNDPAGARERINEHRGVFEQPEHQAEALMILAQAQHALANGARAGLLDAALAYMQVVALFKNDPDIDEVPLALLRAGEIHEELGLADDARTLYRDLVARYGATPAGAQGQSKLDAMAQN